MMLQAINFLRCVPVVSSLLALPGISAVCDGIVQQGQAAKDDKRVREYLVRRLQAIPKAM